MNINDAILSEKPNKKIIIQKINLNQKKEYKNIFLCPKNKHDIVNSIDILDDIIIYGTIMGNVYLCRVDENNLMPKPKKKNLTDLDFFDKVKEEKIKKIIDDSSKISCIKLDMNSNERSSSSNKSIYKINKNEIKKDKSKNFYNSDIMPTTRNIYSKFKNIELNTRKKLLNKHFLQNRNSHSEKSIFDKSSIISQTNNSNNSNKTKVPLPQIVQLVSNANENIPCLSIDTNDIINVAIGDSDIFRFENLSNYNDDNDNYYYTQIKNYSSENEHMKYCEGATCLMSKNNFLLLKSPLAEYYSPLILDKFSYVNKTITTYEKEEGEISMHNFFVPFDFDGNRFLYLEYAPQDLRGICIFYTLEKIGPIRFKVDKSFGHISFMKFISSDKIIICRKNNLCEIRDINNFQLLEEWTHLGDEIIAMNVYIKEIEEEQKFENSMTELSYKKKKNKTNNNIEYIDTNYKNNKKLKNINLYNQDIYGPNNKFHLKKFPFEKDKVNNSTYRELMGMNIKKKLNSNEEKDNEIAIYNNQNNFPSGKENPTNEANNKKNIESISNEFNYIQTKKEFVHRKNNIFQLKQKNYTCDKKIYDKVYILTVDKNGNFNTYHDGKIKTKFNLYDIKNIEQNYKDEEFFSLGFPYFAMMNNKYYVITTDHGIFVISNKY